MTMLKRRHRGGPRRVPLWLILPAVLLTFGFHYGASLFGAWYAFTDWSGIGEARWIGLGNFREILNSPDTRGALSNTLKLAASFMLLVNVLGLSLALALHRILKTRHLLRSLFFLPAVVSA